MIDSDHYQMGDELMFKCVPPGWSMKDKGLFRLAKEISDIERCRFGPDRSTDGAHRRGDSRATGTTAKGASG